MSNKSTLNEEQQIQLSKIENVCIITLTGSPHRANVFTIPLLHRLSTLLDTVEHQNSESPCALLFTGRGSKFFSAGFDLKALTGVPAAQSRELVESSWKILARILVFPTPTFALFNGHAFGLGLFLGLACDHRMMVEGSGRLCTPEITIGLPLGRGFAELSRCKMTAAALRTSVLTGKRWSAKEALKAGIIDSIVSRQEEVLEMAEELVSTAEKGNLSTIKMELCREVYDTLMGGYGDLDTSDIMSKL